MIPSWRQPETQTGYPDIRASIKGGGDCVCLMSQVTQLPRWETLKAPTFPKLDCVCIDASNGRDARSFNPQT